MGLFRSYAKFKIFKRIWNAIRGNSSGSKKGKGKRSTRAR